MKYVFSLLLILSSSTLFAKTLPKTLEEPSLRPGLCVVVGCDKAITLTAAQAKGKYLVQGLCTDKKKIDSIRKELIKKSAYGKVTIALQNGNRLPYIDNLINVLVVVDQGTISREELMRVVAPYGVALFKKGSTWKKVTKAYPKEMDEWKQKGYNAARSSVSQDALVAPPTRLQWLTQEKYDRENLTQLLSAGGRNFYIFNGTKLVARDAFNGTRLWEIEHAGVPWLATKDYLCTIIGIRLATIDTATGKIHKTNIKLSGTPTWNNGIVYTANSAYSIAKKKILWTNPEPKRTEGAPLLSDGKIIIATSPRRPNPVIICRDAKTGRNLWKIPSLGTPSLCYRGKLLIKGPQKDESIMLRKKLRHTHKAVNHCVDLKNGKKLWTIEFYLPAHHGAASMFCIDNSIWVRPGKLGSSMGRDEFWRSYDLNTGKKLKEVPAIQSMHRCFDPRATKRFILGTGVDYLDLKSDKTYSFHGARGDCGLGVTPANGMLYQFPNMCMCMGQVDGVSGVSSHSLDDPAESRLKLSTLLEKGPAYRKVGMRKSKHNPKDWVSLRANNARWGTNHAKISNRLKILWKKKHNVRPSSPVGAGKGSKATVYVALRDSYTVAALAASNGKPKWTFETTGPIDSPPTLAGDAVVFGGEDGWVYVLQATSGKLAWRFRAAPEKRVTLTNGRLASAWPLHGSLLVENGIIYAVAGHHNELDGGLFTYALELKSGKILWKKRLIRQGVTQKIKDSEAGDTGNTILAGDGKMLYSELLHIEAVTGKIKKAYKVGKIFFSGGWPKQVVWGGPHGYLLDLSLPSYTSGHSSSNWIWGNIRANMVAVDGEHAYGMITLHGRFIKRRKKETLFKEGPAVIFCAKKTETKKAWHEYIPESSLVWKQTLPEGSIARAIIKTSDSVIVACQTTEKNGNQAGLILLFNPKTGKEKGRLKTTSPPLWDGLAAAGNQLYLITEDNSLLCLGAK